MKKIIKITICLLFIVLLSSCGCGKKAQNKLIQISGYDAYDFYGAKKSMILVLTDSKNTVHKKLLTDLEKALAVTSSNIYYVDMALADALQYEMLNAAFSSEGYAPQILCIQRGNIVITEQENYDYETIASIVKGKKYHSLDLREKDAAKADYYQRAAKAYADGLISEAFHYYALSIPYQDASAKVMSKDFYLINNWVFEEDNDDYTFLNISFSGESNTMYRRYYSGDKTKFNVDELKIETYKYYLKKKTIYVYDKKSDSYKKMYTIDSISASKLKVHTTKKTYEFKANS